MRSHDSSVADSSRKSTRSVTESVYEVIVENGREYANDSYFMPNDEAEQARLNIINQVHLRALKNALLQAPIDNDITRVLDVGCGPGDWAIAMAEQYPEAEIVAMDIGVWQQGDVPGNVSFQVDDAENEWTFTDPFDLIHLRHLAGAFTSWRGVYVQAYQHLVPGGYLEVADFDYGEIANLLGTDYLHIWASALRSAVEMSKYPRDLSHLEPALLASIGYTEITTRILNLPIGPWPGEKATAGKMLLVALLEGLEAHSLRLLTKYKSWTAEEVRDLCEKAKAELSVWKTGTFFPVRIVVARKTFDISESA